MRKLKYIKAISEAIDEELQQDETVCYFGQDVGEFGGVWGTAPKFQKKYGERRVFDTPLSESAIIGTAGGAAMTGLRPIAEIMYFDFVTVAMDPLVNQVAKLRYMSGGQLKLPLVVLAQFGSGSAEAAQHSQSLEAWFVHTPGLKVVMPSTVYDAKGLLKSAIRDDNPVIFLWNRRLYDWIEEVPDGEWTVPLGQAAVKCEGTDITVVATSYMVHEALTAAETLAGEVSLEVIDPRSIVPLDLETILKSVKKTGRLLVVHEANTCCGIGAEIVRRVTEKAFNSLVAAPKVLGQIGIPMPFSPILESATLPNEEKITSSIKAIMGEH
jgi:acetoin:2,6-dichlorophenolindophenol oxidoreductase subunit beta